MTTIKAGEPLRKQFPAAEVKVLDEDNRIMRFTISTETVDRHGDIIRADGWVLDNYKKNPVVLFAHDNHYPAVAKANDVRVEGKTLVADTQFAPTTAGLQLWELYKGGYMRATSVGFLPIEYGPRKDEDSYGLEFTQQELLEFSLVPIPANPEALARAVDKGVVSRETADEMGTLVRKLVDGELKDKPKEDPKPPPIEDPKPEDPQDPPAEPEGPGDTGPQTENDFDLDALIDSALATMDVKASPVSQASELGPLEALVEAAKAGDLARVTDLATEVAAEIADARARADAAERRALDRTPNVADEKSSADEPLDESLPPVEEIAMAATGAMKSVLAQYLGRP